jgi:hypothetical protein
MAVPIQLRRGTSAAWTTANPILAEGEVGLELDTDRRKVGDGATHWASLLYADTLASLAGWALEQAFSVSSVTRDANGVVTSANIVWPDGVAGVFTTDTIDASNAINAWHATYVGPVTKTVTQAAVTRDANGNVTVQPAITIS